MSNVYTKELGAYFSPTEVARIYENARRYYEASLAIDGIRMPEPLSYTETSITFSYISDLTPTISELWFTDQAWNEDLCYRLGAVLGELHRAQRVDLSQDIYLYGDYVPHNVVYREDELILFDVEPPGYRQSFEQFYYGRNYVDIVSMLFFILIGHSYKRPWRFFRNKKSLVQAYLAGYSDASGYLPMRKDIQLYIQLELSKWYFDRGQQHNWIVKNMKYCFLRVVLFVQWYIYRIV